MADKKTLMQKTQNAQIDFRTKQIRNEDTKEIIGLVLEDNNSKDIITRGKLPNGVDYRLIETSINRKDGVYDIEVGVPIDYEFPKR